MGVRKSQEPCDARLTRSMVRVASGIVAGGWDLDEQGGAAAGRAGDVPRAAERLDPVPEPDKPRSTTLPPELTRTANHYLPGQTSARACQAS